MTPSPPFRLSKSYVDEAFKHLEDTDDLSNRKAFFTNYMVPDVKWYMAGSAHSLAGTRYSIESHSKATFERLGWFPQCNCNAQSNWV